MKFAALQYSPVWEDKHANHVAIERMLREASPALEANTFVLLPELGDTGFSMNLDAIVDDRTTTWAIALAKELKVFIQAGYARREAASGKGLNCAAVISPSGLILGEYQKVHPFSYGKESLHYTGGGHLLIAKCANTAICPMICYDLRFPELWRLAALAGAEVFTIGACWPVARQHHWRALVIARAIEQQAYVVAVNRTGSDPTLTYAGGSLIVSPKGDVLAEANDQPTILQAELNLSTLRQWRTDFPALRDVHQQLLGEIEVQQTHDPTCRF